MKKIFTLLLIANLFAINSSKAQNLPVAVNDTFYVDFSDTAKTYTYNRSTITANDFLGSGTQKRIDTIFYNGVNQVSVVMHLIPTIRVDKINFTTNPGYFGKDSITYYLTDNGTPISYDTAVIYIYVKRKSYENIDLNNINASIDKEVLFYDRENGVAGFEVPKGSGSHTIYASNFWFAGIDAAGQLKGYAETFALNGVNNAGPIGIGSNYSYKWDRVWKVSAIDIQNHIAGLGTTEAITNWPTNRDTSLGQAPDLAPFVDVNGDGFYNPTLGDYPLIKGQQAIYFIRNSDRTPTFTIGGGFEFHGMVYAYDCPEDSAINNTLFLDYTIYNRSPFNFYDAYFGQWADLDIGFYDDDFVGSDVSRGIFYGNNGDNLDESGAGIIGYGSFPPAQGVTFLKGPFMDNDGIDNPFTTDVPTAIAQNGIPYAGLGVGFGDGTIDNEHLGLSHFMYYSKIASFPGDGDPSSAADYYNYLRGRWKDGSIMKWGGNGHYSNPNASNVNADYLLPGTSDPLFWSTNGIAPTPIDWSELTVGNSPGDRRGMGSTGPFTFNPGAVVEMELAFVFGRDYNSPSNNTAGIVVMQERVDSIRSYHANGFATTPCGGAILGAKEAVKENNALSIYPNPFANQFLVSYKPTHNTVVEVYNLLGNQILTQQITQQLTLLDLSNQPNGVYFVRVIDGKEVLTKKVIKQ
jgi:hypothetical protein